MSVQAEEGGTSPALTITEAAGRFKAAFSAQEDKGASETEPEESPDAPEEAAEDSTASEDTEQPEQPESEEETDETEETETETPAPKLHRVKVDGEEIEVTEEELLKGYSRTSDYTRKTQQLAEARKKFEAEELPALRTEREQYAAKLVAVDQWIEANTPKEPDWDTLRQENPAEFAATWADWHQHKEQRESLKAEIAAEQQKVSAERQKQLAAYLEAERGRLLERLPEWSDAEIAKKEKAEMLAYGRELGFAAEELMGVADHRALILLRKAMLHDREQAAKSKARATVEKATSQLKTATPGSPNKRPPVSDVTRAKQRLAKTGSVEDAAAALKLMELETRLAQKKARRR